MKPHIQSLNFMHHAFKIQLWRKKFVEKNLEQQVQEH